MEPVARVAPRSKPCRNDARGRYTGDEPSPKGFGWCARAERIGSTRRGKDGRMWTVIATAKSRRWSPLSTTTTSPKTAVREPPRSTTRGRGRVLRLTHDNGGTPFAVFASGLDVAVYTAPASGEGRVVASEYTKLVKRFAAVEKPMLGRGSVLVRVSAHKWTKHLWRCEAAHVGPSCSAAHHHCHRCTSRCCHLMFSARVRCSAAYTFARFVVASSNHEGTSVAHGCAGWQMT